MITLQFRKEDAMMYVSHIDLLRHMERTLRRTDLPVAYSQGYNPHMLLNLGVTLPLGVASRCEFVTVDVDCPTAEFLTRYNRCCPRGLAGVAAWQVDKNPNLAGTVVAATYHYAVDLGEKAAQIAAIKERASYVIAYPSKKDAEATKDIAPLLYAMRATAKGFDVCMAAGNTTVRPQLLADAIGQEFGVAFPAEGVCRTGQLVRVDGKLRHVEDVLQAVAKEVAHV